MRHMCVDADVENGKRVGHLFYKIKVLWVDFDCVQYIPKPPEPPYTSRIIVQSPTFTDLKSSYGSDFAAGLSDFVNMVRPAMKEIESMEGWTVTEEPMDEMTPYFRWTVVPGSRQSAGFSDGAWPYAQATENEIPIEWNNRFAAWDRIVANAADIGPPNIFDFN